MISESILDKIKKFDAYPKTLQDFQVKTYGGAAVTIISLSVALLLFLSELNFYLTSEISEELLVDVSRGDKLKINFDIVYPHISCSFLSIDAIDSSGDQHININHNIFKRRLDKDTLNPIEDATRDTSIDVKKQQKDEFLKRVQPSTTTTPLDPLRCESCYGAESPFRNCCNTCDEVRQAYSEKGWAIRDYNTIIQCNREGVKKRFSDNSFSLEGCEVYGFVEVTRVAGNLHIAPGTSMEKNHHHLHDLGTSDSSAINTTHIIKHLSFGQQVQASNPLDNLKEVADFGSMAFQYYIKVVATVYVKTDGQVIESNQYAVTRHKKRTDDSIGESSLPGIFFIYELAPMMVKYTERNKSFLHFMTSICAIIGGVFTVAGIIDSMLYHSVNAIKKKIELGKAS